MMRPALTSAIYYLHPLAAGPIESWPRHFERCRRMGFDQVLLGPPFLPGAAGNIFLTADYRRLNPGLGSGDALETLERIAGMARDHGLSLLLDLVLDRVAPESPLAVDGLLYGGDEAPDLPPDPRLLPDIADNYRAIRPCADDDAVVAAWAGRLGEWLEAGIAGFRCDAPQRVAVTVWTRLIAGMRRDRPETSFIAWTPGVSTDEMRALARCGFDTMASSSWAWDYGADWLEEETHQAASMGRLLTMPELPFGPRLAASGPHAEGACRRALMVAATYGEAWLMPMGFEFGASAPLDPAHGCPEAFRALAAHPAIDLQEAVVQANAWHRDLSDRGSAQVVTAPYAPVAAFLRSADGTGEASDGTLVLVNTRLDRPARVDLAPLLPGLTEPPIELAPAEVRIIRPEPIPPVVFSNDLDEVAAATSAPRVAIEAVAPAVDGGRFAVKRIVGESVEVTADIICDGHDRLGVTLLWRPADETIWAGVPMSPLGNDRWAASFPLRRTGLHFYTVEASIDVFATFREELRVKQAAGVATAVDLQEGYDLIARSAKTTKDPAVQALASELAAAGPDRRSELLLADETTRSMTGCRAFPLRYVPELPVEAERKAAGFAAWYELFPRSQSDEPGRHGTFDDVIARLPSVQSMGFDVLYFPPIHPIGVTNRKGRDNALQAAPGDPGSPYAIGSAEGGHEAIHPELGTLADFRRLIAAAAEHGLEIALDFAVQCSPDHPWLSEHPDWFRWRADGSIRYAENPPKKYQDIVNVDFYAEAAMPSLWRALRDIVLFWVGEGVRIFRVDNPHTKPLPFWEWLIADIRRRNPEAIFLAEAFTRPKVMYRLAKIGFSQSYTYFTWRNTAWEMREYLTELTETGVREFFRPHFFVNTPDINPVFLQTAGRPGFLLRAALGATLSGLWGIYSGFELCEADALEGREEYRHSEKYEIRQRDWDRAGNIVAEIRKLNHIRRTNPALHTHLGVRFLDCPNDRVLCYVKAAPAQNNILLIAVSFDPDQAQVTDIDLPPDAFLLSGPGPLTLEDLMRGGVSAWHTGVNRLRLDPADLPFAIWRLRHTAEPDNAP
jgi:starch synthase (maltosyl-transferring)